MVIGDIIGNAKINCGILPNPRYRLLQQCCRPATAAPLGRHQTGVLGLKEAMLGPRALRRWQVLAGSLDPNPHGDMASATQRTPSITRTRRAVSGPKPSRYAEVELHRFGRRSSALDLPSSGCGLASSPKLGGRILGGAKIGGIPFAAGPCEASPISATGRRSLANRLLKARVDGTLCRGDRLRACLGPRTASTAPDRPDGLSLVI